MGEDSDSRRWADELLRARDCARFAERPTLSDASFNLDSGYQVGLVLHEQLEARGFRAVGRKIGFTNPAMWERFSVTQPVWAHMYAQSLHDASGGHSELSLAGMVAPRLEPEVVIKLHCAVPAGDLSPEELAGCIEWAAIGFEVVDSHFPGWLFTAAEAVADFGVHAALVVGPPWHVDAASLHEVCTALRDLNVTLRRGVEPFAVGQGRNALGSPLLALGFLARLLATQPWAPPLRAGEIITTGTLTSLPDLHRGDRWRAEVEGAPLAALELVIRD